jgi:hypothetical protein
MEPILSFVAMFDFLGFKELRRQRGTKGLNEMYNKGFLPFIQHSAAMKGKTVEVNGQSNYVPDFGAHSIDFRIVSDSVFFFSHGNTFEHFVKIIIASHQLLCFGFAGHKAPLRGAIGFGDLMFEPNSIWVGSAIEDAYIGEGKQVWSGCSLTSECEKFVLKEGYIEKWPDFFSEVSKKIDSEEKRKNVEIKKKFLIKCNIPEQKKSNEGPVIYSNREGYALDWTLNMYENASEKGIPDSTNPHAQIIKKNTIDFEKWARTVNR